MIINRIKQEMIERQNKLQKSLSYEIFKSEEVNSEDSDKEWFTIESLSKAKESFENKISKALEEGEDIGLLKEASAKAQNEVASLNKAIVQDENGNQKFIYYRYKTAE